MIDIKYFLLGLVLVVAAAGCSESLPAVPGDGTTDSDSDSDSDGDVDTDADGDSDTDADTDADTDTDTDTDPALEILCENTGGTWDPVSCGDYFCGLPPDCEAIIPGCDCGPYALFYHQWGCMVSEECDCPNPGDPNVGYVSQDTDECAIIDFDCFDGALQFDNSCGCGCIEFPL